MQDKLSPDSILDIVRRLDWRFLLPEPDLSRVAYIGITSRKLIRALKIFSESLTVINKKGAMRANNEKFALIVLENPSYEVLSNVGDLLDQKGNLYIEVHGLAGRIKSWHLIVRWMQLRYQGLGFPSGYCRILNTLGFSKVNVYWHWPNFEACTRIMPLDDHAAVRYVIDQGGSDLRATLEKSLGQALVDTRLLGWTVPCFSLVANRDNE